jgi:hypothetical protein
MTRFEIREMTVVSRREKSARRIQFHPKITVIRGENDTGKSSLMKTIYWTLGAEPARVSKDWTKLDICASVKFSLDGKVYSVVRHKRQFGVFDEDGVLLVGVSGVTHGIGPILAKLFRFELVLANGTSGESETPPPAFYLLPYCMDQDRSWEDSWAAFDRLSQYRDWKRDVTEYHIGLRDNDYYGKKAKLRELAIARVEPDQKERALVKAVDQVRERLPAAAVDLDVARFEAEIATLVAAAGEMAKQQERYRQQLNELSSQRVFLSTQEALAAHVLTEVAKDYTFAVKQPHAVDCPTCGAAYENSVVERFALALDQDRTEELLAKIRTEVSEIDVKVTQLRRLLDAARTSESKARDALDTKRGAGTLRDVIKSEARGEAIAALEAELERARVELLELADREAGARADLERMDSRERRREYLDGFSDVIGRFSILLNVPAPSEVKNFALRVTETGSDAPRAALAYQFAVLSFAWQRVDVFHAPLCIDSPNQQDQDLENYRTMLRFIRDQSAGKSQVILGLVDPQGVEFPGSTIELRDPRRVLQVEAYDTVGRGVLAMVQMMYAPPSSNPS